MIRDNLLSALFTKAGFPFQTMALKAFGFYGGYILYYNISCPLCFSTPLSYFAHHRCPVSDPLNRGGPTVYLVNSAASSIMPFLTVVV
jgi:hypothetical protein